MSSGYEEQELIAIDAALDANPDATSGEVFQATRPYDERAIASVAASRALAGGGGGGSQPLDNWCVVDWASPPTLDAGTPTHYFSAGELTITSQSGSDFSIADDSARPGIGAVFSEAGGVFAAAFFFGSPGGVTLDTGSIEQRWLEIFLTTGDQNADDGFSYGLDAFVPVLDSPQPPLTGDLAVTVASMPGRTVPGGRACGAFGVEFVNPFGADSITGALNNSGKFKIWSL